jgi:hypothetical protein
MSGGPAPSHERGGPVPDAAGRRCCWSGSGDFRTAGVSDGGCRSVAAEGLIVPVDPINSAALTNVFAILLRRLGADPGP